MTPFVCRKCDAAAIDLGRCFTDSGERPVLHPIELHTWAVGDLSLMAAVRLLDDSRLLDHTWTARFLAQSSDFGGRWYVDFPAIRRAVARSPLSGGERALAQAAASLAAGLKIDLGETLLALDDHNLGCLVTAIGVIARPAPPPTTTRPRTSPLTVGA